VSIADIFAGVPMATILIEFIVTYLLGIVARKKPVFFRSFLVLVMGAAWYAMSLFTYDGAAIVGMPTMQGAVPAHAPPHPPLYTRLSHSPTPPRSPAAVFAPELEQGIAMASVPVPSHTASGILIKLHSATLNPSNYKIIPAKMPFVRHMRQFTVGYDASGTVVSIGDDAACAHLKVGDAAFGMAPLGSIGEYAVLGCAAAARKPSCLSHAEAAGLNVAALTSLSALERGGVEKGHKVLILGASGGCGMFGVAIGALLGAEVTGVCSTRNTEFVRQRGAAHVVDYTDAAQMAALQAQGAGSFDVVYDTVSSFDPVDPDYEPSMRPLLKPGGRYS
jgi:NADPH:quinone reductase-like Zn-dependent oxidoreductase